MATKNVMNSEILANLASVSATKRNALKLTEKHKNVNILNRNSLLTLFLILAIHFLL